MGLDQYALSNKKLIKEYVWRKHARLQQFMSEWHTKQNPNEKLESTMNLGFNAGDTPVVITEVILDDLEKAIKSNYHSNFASDGFFWGQQFQEESAKVYQDQDKKFLNWARKELKKGNTVEYSCSW